MNEETLYDFLPHLNRQQVKINFTMIIDNNGMLPFLNVLINRTIITRQATRYIVRMRTRIELTYNVSSSSETEEFPYKNAPEKCIERLPT